MIMRFMVLISLLWSFASTELERNRRHHVTSLLQSRHLDERDRVARRVQDDVAPEDDRRRHAAFGERRVIAPAAADGPERDAEALRREADAVHERRALLRCLDRVAAAADHVKVEICNEAFDAPR